MVKELAIGLSALTALFFMMVIAKRGWQSFQSYRAQSVVDKYIGWIQTNYNVDSLHQITDKLNTINDLMLIEKIIDHAGEHFGFTVFLRELYDATKITDNYIFTLENSKSWKKRVFSCEKLGRIASAKAIPALLSIVRDVNNEDEDVRSSALRALGRIQDARAIPFLIEALGFPETWLPPRIAEILVLIGNEAIEPLTRELNNCQSESRRAWAAEILGTLQAKSAVDALMDSLLDASPEVRAKAAGALGKIKEDRAIIKLGELLVSEPVSFVRTRVSQALGAIGSPKVIRFLVDILKDPEWWVRIRAVEALEQIGENSVPSLLVTLEEDDQEVRKRAAMALEKIGYIRKILKEYGEGPYKPGLRKILFLTSQSGVVESLNEYLFKSTGNFQKRIVRLLGEAKASGAAEPLLQLLDTADCWTLKARIIESLGKIRAKEAIPVLIEYLKDPEYWVRRSSAQALGHLNAVEYSGKIASILKDPNPETRISALRTLSILKAHQHHQEIVELLSDPSPVVRKNALTVIRDLAIKVDTPTITEILKKSSEDIRIEAVKYFTASRCLEAFYDVLQILPYASQALRDCVVEYVEQVNNSDRRFKDIIDLFAEMNLSKEVVGSLIFIASIIKDKDACQFIYDYTRRPEAYTREKAIQALLRFGIEENQSLLEEGLFDPAASVRIAVLAGIDENVNPGFLKKAVALKDDPDEYVRLALELAIGISGCTEWKSELIPLLADASPKVVAGALIALAVLDSESFLEEYYRRRDIKEIRKQVRTICEDERFFGIIQKIKERSSRNQHIEISLLFEIDEREFTARLLDMTKQSADPEIRAKAMETIQRIAAPEHFTSILGVMNKDPHPRVRKIAMDAVASLGREEEAISAFSASLADPVPSVREKAAKMLGDFNNPRALKALLDALDTHNRDFREAVTTSLSRILSGDLETVKTLMCSVPDKKTRKIGLAWIMGKTEKPESIPFLKTLLNDNEQEVRCSAIGALSKFKDRNLSKIIEASIYDPNERVRAAAINAITSTPTETTTETLLNALDDLDDFVRLRAIIGLAKIDLNRAITALESKSQHQLEYLALLNAVLFYSGDAYNESVKSDPKALFIISELCDKEDMLNTLKSSTDNKKRYHAFKILSLFESDENYKTVYELAIKDPDTKIRQEAEKQTIKGM